MELGVVTKEKFHYLGYVISYYYTLIDIFQTSIAYLKALVLGFQP
jgi:hypothetical protein